MGIIHKYIGSIGGVGNTEKMTLSQILSKNEYVRGHGMEKTIEKDVMIRKISHDFYCDKCNTFIGSSEEYIDGYYDELGEFETSIYIEGHGHFKYKKNLCKKCIPIVTDELISTLKNIGFVSYMNK